jgi:hypothetical protein
MTFSSSNAQARSEVAALGIEADDHGLVMTFEIDEADPRWPDVASWMERRQPAGMVRTEFTSSEIGSARWLEMRTTWHHGYPQPGEGEFGYRRATYDLVDWCQSCGSGMRQNAPFQLKDEPRWGNKGLLQVNWVFDEFFVKPEVWETVFRPHGVARRPVIDTRGNELVTVVQLVVEEAVPVAASGLPGNRCPRCGQMIYLPVARGAFPALMEEPRDAIARTREYFGSGASASRPVLVNSSIAQALVQAKVRGVALRPVAASGDAVRP